MTPTAKTTVPQQMLLMTVDITAAPPLPSVRLPPHGLPATLQPRLHSGRISSARPRRRRPCAPHIVPPDGLHRLGKASPPPRENCPRHLLGGELLTRAGQPGERALAFRVFRCHWRGRKRGPSGA